MGSSKSPGGIGSAISRTLAWCGGATSVFVDDFPEERTRLASIGCAVVSTGLFAVASSAYALFTIFGDSWWVPVLAVLWGVTIFNIDRLIVMTMQGGELRRFLTALPRLFLATVIAFVVSRPLELWICSPEIARGLEQHEADERTAANNEWSDAKRTANEHYDAEVAAAGVAASVPVRQGELDAASRDVRECDTDAKKASDEYKAELDGTGGTGRIGDGPIAKKKYVHYLDERRRCDAMAMIAERARAALDSAVQQRSAATRGHESARENDLAKAAELLRQRMAGLKRTRADSLLGRNQELGRLKAQDSSVWWMVFLINTLFWLIEALPVVAKLMAGESVYDSVVKDRRDAALAASRGVHDALSHHQAAGEHAAQLAAKVRHDEGEEAAQVLRAAMELRYSARQNVVNAARDRLKVSEEAVTEAVALLERDARLKLERGVSDPLPESTLPRQIKNGAIPLGITAAVIFGLFFGARVMGPFAKADLVLALTVGAIVMAWFTGFVQRFFTHKAEDGQ